LVSEPVLECRRHICRSIGCGPDQEVPESANRRKPPSEVGIPDQQTPLKHAVFQQADDAKTDRSIVVTEFKFFADSAIEVQAVQFLSWTAGKGASFSAASPAWSRHVFARSAGDSAADEAQENGTASAESKCSTNCLVTPNTRGCLDWYRF
jgi:hypothetical protein